MDWGAIGAIGSVMSGVAVAATLWYLAVQVRHAKNAAADQNRLERSRAVREMALMVAANPQIRYDQIRSWGLESYYDDLGAKLNISPERASGVDWANTYYFWMYWGQYSSTTTAEDLQELTHVIEALLTLPSMRGTWETSPFTRPVLEPKFVAFVDAILQRMKS